MHSEVALYTERFMPWWNDEFLNLEYSLDIFPKYLLCVFVMVLLTVFGDFMKPPSQKDCLDKELVVFSITGPEMWNPIGWSLFNLGLRHYMLYVIIPTWPAERKRKLYPVLVIIMVTCSSFMVLYVDGLLGDRPIDDDTCNRIAQVSSGTNYTAWSLPQRWCVDTNPRKTILEWPYAQSIGCDSTFLATTFPRYIEIQFLYTFLRVHWQTAVTGALIKVFALVVVLIGTGSYGWHMVYGAGLHLMMGFVAAYMCYLRTEEARSQFAKAKHAKFGRNSQRSAVTHGHSEHTLTLENFYSC